MLREAKVNDYLGICKVATDDLGYKCEPELVKYRLENIDTNREKVYVAETEEKIVGFIHAEIYNTLYYKSMVNLQGLAVDSEFRHKGYGRALLGEVETWAKRNGIDLIRVNSGFSRKEAHAFYRNLGYDNEKEQIRFVGLERGNHSWRTG